MNTPPLPDKKYSVIYADPPWKYYKGKGQLPFSKIENHYNTMSEDELKALPVNSITDNDCILFLWATGISLPQAIKLGDTWDFKYITVGFVWDKQHTVFGRYTHSQCEYCLIFKHGKIPQPRGKFGIKQFISARRGKHSQKPTEVRERITEMFPTQSKIELFARPTPLDYGRGWDFWGNEV